MKNTSQLKLWGATRACLRVLWAPVAVLVALTCRVAHAATDAAQASADSLVSIVATYGPSLGTMYVAYLVIRSVADRAAATAVATGSELPGWIRWLRTGKRLAYLTSALGITGAALQAALLGSSWTVILAAAAAAAFKLIMPSAPLLIVPPTAPLVTAQVAGSQAQIA